MEPIKEALRPRTGLLRWLLLAAGTLALGLGALGLIVPGLPTTPFVLIAAACYIRSSERLYRWLISNQVFGPVVTTWQAEHGLTIRTKLITLALVWITLGGAALYVLRQGEPVGERLAKIASEQNILLMVCDRCAIERGLAEGDFSQCGMGEVQAKGLVEGVVAGCFPQLYAALAGNPPDQVISL